MAKAKTGLSAWDKIVLNVLPAALNILNLCLTSETLKEKMRDIFVKVVAVAQMAVDAFSDDPAFLQDVKDAKEKFSGKK